MSFRTHIRPSRPRQTCLLAVLTLMSACGYQRHLELSARPEGAGGSERLALEAVNTGSETIVRLLVAVVFSEESGTEIGHTGWTLVETTGLFAAGMERLKDPRFSPLPPGASLQAPVELERLLAGEPELKARLASRWPALDIRLVPIEIETR